MLHKYFDCFFLLLSFLAIIRGKNKACIVSIHLKTNYECYRYNTNTHLHLYREYSNTSAVMLVRIQKRNVHILMFIYYNFNIFMFITIPSSREDMGRSGGSTLPLPMPYMRWVKTQSV